MTIQVVMPQMGESLSEGTIIKWYKKAGEPILRDEPLFEISTDKVDTEVPAPASGVVDRILVNEGETVAVGTVVAEIGGAAQPEAKSGTKPEGTESAPTPAPGQAASASAPSSGGGHFKSAHEPQTFQRKRGPAGARARTEAPTQTQVQQAQAPTPTPARRASATV